VGRQLERLQHWRRLKGPLPGADETIRERLAAPHCTAAQAAEALVDYFWQTHRHALDRHGTMADYPGWPSMYGARNDAIEGVARLAPLWAVCVERRLGSPERQEAMREHLLRMFAHGCDPAHPGFWGPMRDRSTLICEAHDLALALWISREQVYARMPGAVQRQVTEWLAQAVGRGTADNNWHLFVVMADAVLAQLRPGHRFRSQERWQRIWEFQRADGCFVDGPKGHVDLYNAWGFHYPMGWLARIQPELGAARIDDALSGFCAWYQWLFTETGLPLFGRSLCYRHAACVPLVRAATVPGLGVGAGVAAAAFLANWRSFTLAGGLRAGRPTQGVFADDIRWLDVYSGPASSLWGVRSLVEWLQVAHGAGSHPIEQLPAHAGQVDRWVQGLGAQLRAQAGRSELRFAGEQGLVDPVRRPGWRDILRQLRHATASRPDNNRLKAGVRHFGSDLALYR
jgi:hypothetical protein